MPHILDQAAEALVAGLGAMVSVIAEARDQGRPE